MDSFAAVNHDHLEWLMVKINPMSEAYIVMWQADIDNTKERLLPVCEKAYHNIKENLPHLEELANRWNYTLL